MPRIQKIGGFEKTDGEGFLINERRLELIPPSWAAPVNDAKESYLRALPGKIHSIYLRGSVPLGRAVEGISDVDTFAVAAEETPNEALSWIHSARENLKQKYPFVSNFEFHLLPLAGLLKSYGYLSYRFIIKNLSVCLYGEDLSGRLPRYKPTLSIAWAFHGNIGEVVGNAIKGIESAEDPKRVQTLCTWVMKRILRTGFSIFMEEERLYTRDLYFCYEVFSKHYPPKEGEMAQALEGAIRPTFDKGALTAFLKDFGLWVSDTAREKFKASNRK